MLSDLSSDKLRIKQAPAQEEVAAVGTTGLKIV